MVDDLFEDGDGTTGRGVGDEDEERNLEFRVLGVLGLRVRRLTGVFSPELRGFRGRSSVRTHRS
jgi:hypothetical protein